MDVTQFLLNAQSPDASIRGHAEESLKQFQEQNFNAYVIALSHELANSEKPNEARNLAGLLLKNVLSAKDAAAQTERNNLWIAIDPEVSRQIKSALLSTLGSNLGKTAAQVIAAIAAIDLPKNHWPDLVVNLLGNMSAGQSPQLKQNTLQTLGFVCEEIAGTGALAQEQVNSVLTAVVQGMNSSEPNNDVRLAATQALYNALEFARTNFETDVERNYIMTVVCEATQCPDVRVRVAAFECLVAIASAYYEKLAPYIQDIFNISAKATREDEEDVALQAIELWSAICEEEIAIQEEVEESADSEATNFQFIRQAMTALVPMLLETLSKQDDDPGLDDRWSISMAGGTCLDLVSRTVGDSIVDLVMPYVQENITKPDWKLREAATFAFGSILEGPSPEKLTPLVTLALNFLLAAMKDNPSHVKDTTAWTLSRIFQFLHSSDMDNPVINSSNLPLIIATLLESMNDAPNVAEKVCGAFNWLAQGYEAVSGVSPLSPYLQNIIQVLLNAADRGDVSDSRLRVAAYETLNEVVRCSTEDTIPIIMALIPVIIEKLNVTMDMHILSSDDREKQGEIQASLCGCLQVIIQKLSSNESTIFSVLQFSDQMMQTFLKVFACRSATVHQESMLAIGALANAIGAEFAKYMPEFSRYLEMGLQNFEEYQVCSITIGVVGDICRALGEKVLPFCDSIMTQLLKDLSSNQLHRSVKPPIFSCFGDISLAIEDHFEKYLNYVMPMLQGAAEHSVTQLQQSSDDELLDYNNQLRVGILDAYSGILMGLKKNSSESLKPFVEFIMAFIENVFNDKERDEYVSKGALSVIGDLGDVFGPTCQVIFKRHTFYLQFIEECMNSEDPSMKETAEWVHQVVANVVQ